MTTPQPRPRPVDFDGLVIEDAQGTRLLAIPAALLPVLRSATVIRYRRGDSFFSMRVDTFTDSQLVTEARDELAPRVEPPLPAGSAPTPEYGAPDLPVTPPSPTPPPLPEEVRDPANIPVYVKRGGSWVTKHVTREEYERYQAQGRLTQEAPGVEEEQGEGQ